MKFGVSVLLEIVNAVQQGIATGSDVSEHLRQVDVQLNEETGKLELSDEFLKGRGDQVADV
jgi:hypothetical protein